MSAEVDQLIVKARHALDTGQPRLAELYIVKARHVVLVERQAMKQLRVERALRQVIQTMVAALTPAVQAAGEAFTGFATAYAEADAKAVQQQFGAIRRRDYMKFQPKGHIG